MKQLCYLLLFVFLSACIFGQPTHFVGGKIQDAATQQVVKYAALEITGTIKGGSTDSNGVFKLNVPDSVVLVKISAIGYESKHVQLRAGQMAYIIVLKPKASVLEEVVVNALPFEPVIKSPRSNVLDYDFYGDNVLLITFGNSLRHSKLVLVSVDLDTLGTMNLPEEPVKLYKDCLGNLHVVCGLNIYQVYYDQGQLSLLEPKDIKALEAVLMPCVDKDSSNLFVQQKYGAHPVTDAGFHTFMSHNFSVMYSMVNMKTKVKKELAMISDKGTITMSNDEADFERNKAALGLSTRGDKVFAETIVFTEVYAPLYVINNCTYIFDYVNARLIKYNNGREEKTMAIDFHKQKTWKRNMCIDVAEGKAYAVFEKDGISELKQIDLLTGSTIGSYKLPVVFAQNIKVHKHYVYFIDKDAPGQDARYLARLRLF